MSLQGRKVLVTGAGGFIGSHLAEELTRSGAKVRAFVHYNALGKAGWLDESPIKQDMEVVAGDVTDSESVMRAVEGTEIVFHLAALIAIPYSYVAPYSYVKTNVEGTLNVLQAARKHECERVLHTSTSEVYGTAQYVPIDEKHPLQGQSPYSASKIGADKMAEAFHLSFKLPVVTIRPFNTFGPRQSTRAIIPTVINQLLGGNAIKLGNLHPTRDLNYVSNTVDGFIKGATAPSAVGNTINLGSGREISISNLVSLIAKKLDKEVKIEQEEVRLRPNGSEVERLLADNSRAQNILDWHPLINLEEGLEKTIEWLQNRRDRSDPNRYTI